LKVDHFLRQHRKSNLDQIFQTDACFLSPKNFPSEYSLTWQDCNDASLHHLAYYKSTVTGHLSFYVRQDFKTGRLHCNNKKRWGDLRVKCVLSSLETAILLAKGREKYYTEDGGIYTTPHLVNPISIYRKVKLVVLISKNFEKSQVKGWKAVSTAKEKYLKAALEISNHLQFYLKWNIHCSTEYNYALFNESKVEDFEPSKFFYCNAWGRIVNTPSPYTVEIKVTSIDVGNGKFIKTLSWEPASQDLSHKSISSAICHAVLGQTTIHLSNRFGLNLCDQTAPLNTAVKLPIRL